MRNTLFSLMAERTKHIHVHVQRSFHFLVECHKTLAKRLIEEMTSHQTVVWDVYMY